MDLRWLGLAGWFLLPLVAVAGCGGGGSPTTGGAEVTSPANARLLLPQRQSRQERRVGCVSAIASAGRQPDSIVVRARCSPKGRPREVNFTVDRFVPGNPLRRVVAQVTTGAPSIESRGKSLTDGACTSRGRSVACHARIRDPSTIRVELRVPPSTRCSAGVAVVSVVEKSCRRGLCVGPLTVRPLFRGRPKGC